MVWIFMFRKYYSEAQELIKDAASRDDYDKEIEAEKEFYQSRRLTYVWVIIAAFYFPFLIWLIYKLVKRI